MIKYLPVLLLATTLVACSSDDDDTSTDGTATTGTGTTTAGTGGDTAGTGSDTAGTTAGTTGGDTTTGGTTGGGEPGGRSGAYIGTMNAGRGVYVIDNNNYLSGLSIAADGSATSVFGSIGADSRYSGPLTVVQHPAGAGSVPAFGNGDRLADDYQAPTFTFDIVDGQSISGGDVNLVYAGGSELTPVTAGALDGTWGSNYEFGCEASNCHVLETSVIINGTSVSGSTRYKPIDGDYGEPLPINGTISEFGGVALLSFIWRESDAYQGIAYFSLDDPTQLVFLGTSTENVENPTIAALLTRQ